MCFADNLHLYEIQRQMLELPLDGFETEIVK